MNLKEFKENGVAWDASWVFGDLLIRKYEYKGTCSDGRVAFEEQRWRYNYQTGQVTAEKDNRALVRSIVMRKLILIACYPTREEAIQSLIDECDSRMENLKKELETLPKVKTWLQDLKQGAFALAADSSGRRWKMHCEEVRPMCDCEELKEVRGILGAVDEGAPEAARRIVARLRELQWAVSELSALIECTDNEQLKREKERIISEL